MPYKRIKKKNKRHEDNKNEGIGIVSIIVILIVTVIGLYYFFSPRSHHVPNEGENINVPLEVPSPVKAHER